MVVCMRGTIFSSTAKPAAKKKYRERLDAEKAKKLELDERSEFTLNAAGAALYRARSARCNYLSQDRPDLAFSSKELFREFNTPNLNSFKKLKRLVRYSCGMPRLVQPSTCVQVAGLLLNC